MNFRKSALGGVVRLSRDCARSRLGWALAAIHALWFYLGILSMGRPSRAAANFLDSLQGADWTLFAGRPFHFTYQSWVLKSVLLVDIPSLLVASVGDLLLAPLWFTWHIGTYAGSYVGAGLLFVVATGQWLMLGFFVQKRFRSRVHRT
jgi:hypothetical protein